MSSFDFSYAIILQDKFSSVASRVNSKLTGLDESIKKTSKRVEKLGSKFSSLARRLILPTAALILLMKKGAEAADTQEVAIKILGLTIGKHNKYLKEIIENSEKFTRVTRFSQESILNMTQTIAQFTKSGRMASETILPLMNLASGLHLSLSEAALMFSKSLTSPINELQRYGIVIKKGLSGLAKYKAMLAAIHQKFGGTAVAMGQTGLGQIVIMGNLIGDIWKDVAADVLPVLDKLAKKLMPLLIRIDKFVKQHKTIVKWAGLSIIILTALATVAMVLAGAISLLLLPFGIFEGMLGGLLAGFLVLTWPIMAVLAAITALSIGVVALYKHFKMVRDIAHWVEGQFGFGGSTHHSVGINHLVKGNNSSAHVTFEFKDPGNILAKTKTSDNKSEFLPVPNAKNMGHVYV